MTTAGLESTRPLGVRPRHSTGTPRTHTRGRYTAAEWRPCATEKLGAAPMDLSQDLRIRPGRCRRRGHEIALSRYSCAGAELATRSDHGDPEGGPTPPSHFQTIASLSELPPSPNKHRRGALQWTVQHRGRARAPSPSTATGVRLVKGGLQGAGEGAHRQAREVRQGALRAALGILSRATIPIGVWLARPRMDRQRPGPRGPQPPTRRQLRVSRCSRHPHRRAAPPRRRGPSGMRVYVPYGATGTATHAPACRAPATWPSSSPPSPPSR